MKRDAYWQKPKKARGVNCDAWWYANVRTIEIHADPAEPGCHVRVVLTRKQVAEYLKRSARRGDKQ